MWYNIYMGNQRQKEIYLIRIFRRSTKEGETLVGIVEDVLGKRTSSFKTPEELFRLLTGPESADVKDKKTSGSK